MKTVLAAFSLDDLGHGDAELFLDQNHFAARHQPVVDVDVDGLADAAVELEHGARAEFQQLADLHARPAEHGRDLHRHVEHRFQVLCAARDRFGHLRGDELLGAIGAQLGRIMRSTDVRCRYGGDEFLVILPETHILGAQQVAEGLRQDVAGMRIGSDDGRGPVTISVGVAASAPGELDAKALIQRADQALYRAKRNGRDRAET